MAPFEFRLPDLGEGIHEAQVLAWKVAPGQAVRAFDPLCEVESAKAAVELTTPVAGQVVETRVDAGDMARTGDVLVVIATTTAEGPGAQTSEADWFGIVGQAPSVASAPAARRPTASGSPPGQPAVRAAPLVRRVARERGIRLEDVAGSGPQGRVRLSDLDAAGYGVHGERDETADREVVPLVGLRKSIADHMSAAWQHAPQVTAMDMVDVTELVRARDVLRQAPDAAHTRLTYLPFFVKATLEALKAVPMANARLNEDQHTIERLREFHIGIATAVRGGLVVPVVRHADRLSVLDLASEIERLVALAREQKIAPRDLTGSTFTITSFGGMPGGPLFATPILNYPEVGILGLGRVDLHPRVVDGQVVPRHCIGVSFTFDHRVLDGEDAGRFMAAFRRPIEQPLELLLRLR